MCQGLDVRDMRCSAGVEDRDVWADFCAFADQHYAKGTRLAGMHSLIISL